MDDGTAKAPNRWKDTKMSDAAIWRRNQCRTGRMAATAAKNALVGLPLLGLPTVPAATTASVLAGVTRQDLSTAA